MKIITAREQVQMLAPWRTAAHKATCICSACIEAKHKSSAPKGNFREPVLRADIPLDVLKQYSTFNPYEPEDGEPPGQAETRMADYEKTLKTQGWDGFGKLGDPPSYPTLSFGRSGQHAVLNGHHRLWAADRLGLTHVPVEIFRHDDDDWAATYGRPVEPHVSGLLGGAR